MFHIQDKTVEHIESVESEESEEGDGRDGGKDADIGDESNGAGDGSIRGDDLVHLFTF